MRRRLNLSLPSDLYDLLERIRKDYGFRSTCEMVLVLLRAYCLRVCRSEAERMHGGSLSDEIGSMFGDYSDWEPTPTNTVVPKRHRTNGEK